MSYQETISSLLKQYQENCDLENECNQKLSNFHSKEVWISNLKNRSKVFRKIYASNQNLQTQLSGFLSQPFTPESASCSYDALMFLYNNAYDDCEIMDSIAAALINYYEPLNDYEHLVPLYHLLGFEYTEKYTRILGDGNPYPPQNYFFKVVALKDHYTEIKDEHTRRLFFTSYTNLIAPLCLIDSKLRPNLLQIYQEALDFWNRPEVQKLDGHNPFIQKAFETFRRSILYIEECLETLPTEMIDDYYKVLDSLRSQVEANPSSDLSGNYFRAIVHCHLRKKLISPKEAIELLLNHLDELEEPDFQSEDKQETALLIIDYHNTSLRILSIIEQFPFTSEEIDGFLDRFFEHVMEIHTSIPMHFCSSMMNTICAEWFGHTEHFILDIDDKIAYLMKMIVTRQPSTYAHCIMVKHISSAIAHTLLETNPSFFLGVLGYETIDEILAHQEDLLAFIERSALLHDIGKCTIVDIINMQTRELFERENKLIRLHPYNGLSILKNSKEYDLYRPIILGHHRYYDGSYGYPSNFDNCAQRDKAIIDLITISDCLDAATDYLGRNYNIEKDLATVIEEIQKQAGTRYHPYIAQLLTDNEKLYQHLLALTRNLRQEIYYTSYRNTHIMPSK